MALSLSGSWSLRPRGSDYVPGIEVGGINSDYKLIFDFELIRMSLESLLRLRWLTPLIS